MREILFRGKRISDNVWVTGNLFIPDFDNSPTQICIGTNVTRISYNVFPETVGQFTGLTDKNGTEIFEGDICSTDLDRPYNVVKFSHGCFVVSCNDGRGEYEDTMIPLCEEDGVVSWTEVVGNIYDNPKLLEN